ncbi:MAG TPA: hypothetical protein PKX55_22505, partial [Leptospiraceae bacterium]|nr:hypothetical protein [Leptospiraceae bacterium]
GGYSGNIFFLPAQFDHFKEREDNLEYYIFRVIYLSIQKKLNLNWEEEKEKDKLTSRKMAENSFEKIYKEMISEYPAFKERADRIIQLEKDYAKEKDIPLYFIYGRWMYKTLNTVDGNLKRKDFKNQSNEITTEKEAKPIEYKRTIDVNKEEIENYTLNHNFEKVETIEEFKGNWRDLDGSDELNIQEDALKEVDLHDTIRVDDPTHSIYSADFWGMTSASESNLIQNGKYYISYSEWDFKKKKYKENFCRISHSYLTGEKDDSYKACLEKYRNVYTTIKRMFLKTWNDLEKIKHQNTGEEIDLDKIVENYANIHAGKTSSEKVYIQNRKRKKDISILILMDLSLSTDSYTEGKRILDIEKDSIVLFSELLDEFGVNFQIDGFYSRTRSFCDYITIKSFKDHWKDRRNRIGNIHSIGYTRIGPALRHSTAILKSQNSESKWILLLSDAKPNDYDRYEGKYGIKDIQQSVREANKDNVGIYTLSVTKSDNVLLSEMFGNRYKVLANPNLLPEALTHFYLELLKT